MKLALVSDAWVPQVNGVVRTLQTTVGILQERGHAVDLITPDRYRTIACPTYPEIRLAIASGRRVGRELDVGDADAIHIATEGPLGWAARRWCLRRQIPFTTSFHTHFPDYAAMRTGLPAAWFWRILRRFHGPAATIFTATESLDVELRERGLPNTTRWSRGIDLSLFSPDGPRLAALDMLPRPLLLCVGRVAVEKNIEAFLNLDCVGTKVIVGDGPARKPLQIRYPRAHFLGTLHGAELAAAYRSADVLVFPSLTDTFGLVIIEALASGLPVAAYPVRGPIDIIGHDGRGNGERCGPIGSLNNDLAGAISAALAADRGACTAEGRRYTWASSTDQFMAGIKLRHRQMSSF